MMVASNLNGIKIYKAATGAVVFPTNLNITSAEDYEVILLEGVGTVTYGSKTAIDFDVIQTGACNWLLVLTKPNSMTSPV
jgi:high-affinity K+ transport system ATPase subunit B